MSTFTLGSLNELDDTSVRLLILVTTGLQLILSKQEQTKCKFQKVKDAVVHFLQHWLQLPGKSVDVRHSDADWGQNSQIDRIDEPKDKRQTATRRQLTQSKHGKLTIPLNIWGRWACPKVSSWHKDELTQYEINTAICISAKQQTK